MDPEVEKQMQSYWGEFAGQFVVPGGDAEWGEPHEWRKALDVRGLYALLNGMEIVYVGKATRSIGSRIRDHRRERFMVFNRFGYIDFGWDPDIDLAGLEREAIQELDPLYNLRMSGYDIRKLAIAGKIHLREKDKPNE